MNKKVNAILVFLLLLAALSITGCDQGSKRSKVTLFAAASTADLMTAAAERFEKDYGIEVQINSSSSGTLARQLEQGADADLFISALVDWIDYVETLGLVDESMPMMKNRLVLVSHRDSALEPFNMSETFDLPSYFTSRLSMGDPDHVPAGKYGRIALESMGWYDSLSDRLLPAAHVRAALSVVEFDEAQLGIVYQTDAIKSTKVKILSFFPESSHPPVLYYCARLITTSPSGRLFYDYLRDSEEVDKLLIDFGFSLPEKEG